MDEVGVVLAAPGHGAAPGAEALIRAGLLSPSACHRVRSRHRRGHRMGQ